MKNLARAIQKLPHVLVFDNSDLADPFRKVAEYHDGKPLSVNEPIPSWLPLAKRLGRAAIEEAVIDEKRDTAQRIRAIEVLTDVFGGLAESDPAIVPHFNERSPSPSSEHGSWPCCRMSANS